MVHCGYFVSALISFRYQRELVGAHEKLAREIKEKWNYDQNYARLVQRFTFFQMNLYKFHIFLMNFLYSV